MILQHFENWLAEIGAADHPNHTIRHQGNLSVATAQAAFDAQYAKGDFVVRDHGTVLTVWSYPGYRRWREGRGEDPAAIEEKILFLKSHD